MKTQLFDQSLYGVGITLAIGTAIATVLGFLGSLDWQLALLDHLRPHYILSMGLAIVLLWRYGSKPWITKPVLLVGLVALSMNSALLLPVIIPSENPFSFFLEERSGPDSLSIVHFNLARNNRQRDRVIDYLNQQNADLLLLQEVTPEWLAQIERGITRYDIVTAIPRTNSQGSALLQRRSQGQGASTQRSSIIEVVNTQVKAFPARSKRPILVVEVNWQGQPMSILSLHVTRPLYSPNARYQKLELELIAKWVQSTQTPFHPIIVLGDFNSTPWSQVFRTFQRQSTLTLSQQGWGLKSTWPARLPPFLQIPIDCCLHSASLRTVHYQIGPNLGSDHRPIAVQLQLQ